ncbi:MAG: hypothetical protein Q8S21_00465 [Candidatus Paracaedibacteraceae bacterium]|nr:hypothetical protein [Candidatus Paracaedibacteraceae bacterium]
MGVKFEYKNFSKTTQLFKELTLPWLSKETGGFVALTSFVAIALILSMIKTQKTLIKKESVLAISNSELRQTEKLFFLDEQYQSELDNHLNTKNIHKFHKFNQPTTVEILKDYLKKWQTALRIKALNVEIGNAEVYNQGQGIMTASIKLKAHVLNDKMLYQLIEKLQTEAPGVIIIRNVDFKRTSAASTETLNQLISGKATPLIEGTIICNWFFLGAQ